ncbi:hypothetical protein P3S67_025004 [Capsicum chacoense]
MQRGSSNSDLPTENYISGESIGRSSLIPTIVTPFQGTHTLYVQGSERMISQPVNLSVPARVSLNHETGAHSPSSALTSTPSPALSSSSSRSIGSIISQNASYTVVGHGHRQDLGSTSENLDVREYISTTNSMLPNEATFDFGHVRTMAYAAPRIIYGRPESPLIVMVPDISGNNYFSYGTPAILVANGTSTYFVSIIPRNSFSYWIPTGMLSNTLTPVLPVMHAPGFLGPLPHFSGNWTYSTFQIPYMYPVMNHTPRFAGVNPGPSRMPLHPHPSNFHTGLLAIQGPVGSINTGLSREVILARMKCVKYELAERSTSDNDMCCICFEDFSEVQKIGSIDCQHTFHFDCISQWLMQKNSCPLCRRTALAI